jgi:hypothetical protein
VKTHTKSGALTPYAFACGYIEHHFAPLRTITIERANPDYVVTVLNGLGNRLVVRASFTRLTDARKYAKALRHDLTVSPVGGVNTL